MRRSQFVDFWCPRLLLTSSALHAAAVALILMLAPGATNASDHPAEVGRWQTLPAGEWDKFDTSNPPKLMSGGGTHMNLLRGNLDSTWVLHWHLDYQARLWLAKPMDNGAGVGVAVGYGGSNIFCAGHTQLADGKALVVGGSIVGTTGENRCHTFDATRYFETSTGWRQVDSTAAGRYYPTVTTLADGKVLTTGGGLWDNMVMFGGETPTTLRAFVR